MFGRQHAEGTQMRMQLLFADGEGRNWKVFGPRPAEDADERKVSCGPPRGEGCGPHSPTDCIFVFWSAVRRRRRTCASHRRVAVRRGGAAANCAVRRTAKYTRVSLTRGRSDFGQRAAHFNGTAFVFLLRASAIHASMIALGLVSVGSTFWVTKGGNNI